VSLYAKRVGPLSVLLAVAVLAPTMAAGAEESSREHTSVVVRVYELGTKSPRLTGELADSVTRLLKGVDARVNVLFVDCAQQDACVEPAPDALVLRLTPGRHPVSTRQCGEASIGKPGQRGVLMTVFRGCVLDTRRELRADAIAEQGVAFALLSLSESDILGAVVVHELIHLALPEESHGKGLFKATLDARDWMELAAGWPQLDTALVSRLGRALAVPPDTQSVVAHRRSDATSSTP
jgi:hypothetical protein